MKELVCVACKELGNNQDIKCRDCTSSFISQHSYFKVEVYTCFTCSDMWIECYYEDFTNTPVWEEFGERFFIKRKINRIELNQIIQAENLSSLDINSFGINT